MGLQHSTCHYPIRSNRHANHFRYSGSAILLTFAKHEDEFLPILAVAF